MLDGASWMKCGRAHQADTILHLLTFQAPIQLNSLTGTYATSTYLAALRKSSQELEKLSKDIDAFEKKMTSDEKVSAFIRESDGPLDFPRACPFHHRGCCYFTCLGLTYSL